MVTQSSTQSWNGIVVPSPTEVKIYRCEVRIEGIDEPILVEYSREPCEEKVDYLIGKMLERLQKYKDQLHRGGDKIRVIISCRTEELQIYKSVC